MTAAPSLAGGAALIGKYSRIGCHIGNKPGRLDQGMPSTVNARAIAMRRGARLRRFADHQSMWPWNEVRLTSPISVEP